MTGMTSKIPLYILLGFILLIGTRLVISDNYQCLESITVCGDNIEHLVGCTCVNDWFEEVPCDQTEWILIDEHGVGGVCVHHSLFGYEWREL